MEPAELFEEAERRAAILPPPSQVELELERLRTEVAQFGDQVPEPPLYLRAEDPARQLAGKLLPTGTELLARCLAAERASVGAERLSEPLKAYLEVLCHSANGHLEQAERTWQTAGELERQVLRAHRLWRKSDEDPPPVFDRATGRSRFDPRPDTEWKVKLVCPWVSCRQPAEHVLSAGGSTSDRVCAHCRRRFSVYVAEVRGVARELDRRRRSYVLQLEELSGARARLAFDDPSGAELSVARGDLLAFLYADHRRLQGVLNLSTGRLLWVGKGEGPCFVVTVAFGEDSPELDTFREFRDRVLQRSALGRGLVAGYYLLGPVLARRIEGRRGLVRVTRLLLRRVHRVLVRSGFGT